MAPKYLGGNRVKKNLRSLATCLSVNNNLRGKLVSSLELPITFDIRFKLLQCNFFPDFSEFSRKLDNFIIKVSN